MSVTKQPQTKVLSTVSVGKDIKKSDDLVKLIGRALGSPINGRQVGEEFDVTLTGNIEIREFNGQKGAYFTTKEGYSIRVNASFNPATDKADAVKRAVCLEIETETGKRKYCAFAA